jgi:hypothetical protein
MTTTTYTVNTIDTDARQAWMDTPGIVRYAAGAQDSGRCRFDVETTDAAALESALNADADVIDYEVL